MLRDIEKRAAGARLRLKDMSSSWFYDPDAPHLSSFCYRILDEDSKCNLGTIDGYRITHDWTVQSDLRLWEEADSLDVDVAQYVDALIRELRACEAVFQVAPTLTLSQRTTIVRHIELVEGRGTPSLSSQVVASIAMMDAPVLMLVDPWPMPEQRAQAEGRLGGRGVVATLLQLGFSRMISSRFVWAWNREMSECMLAEHSFEELLDAKRSGALDEVLRARIAEELHGPYSEILGFPEPEDYSDE